MLCCLRAREWSHEHCCHQATHSGLTTSNNRFGTCSAALEDGQLWEQSRLPKEIRKVKQGTKNSEKTRDFPPLPGCVPRVKGFNHGPGADWR